MKSDASGIAEGHGRSRSVAYLLAVAATTATLAGRLSLASWFGDRPVLILFVLPIFLSAYIGGLGPGLVATTMAALATKYFLIPPLHSFAMGSSTDTVHWLILVVLGVLISTLTETRLKKLLKESDPTIRHGRFSTERKVQTAFAFALACVGAIGIISYLSVGRLREEVARVQQSEEVIAALRLLLATITDAESSQRGHTITGDESYLDADKAAKGKIDGQLQELRKLTADNAEQQRQMDTLEPLVERRMAIARQIAEVRRSEGFAAAQAATATGAGKVFHERVGECIAGMEGTERGLLRQRELSTQRGSAITRTVIAGGSALALAIVAVALLAIGRDFAGSRRAEAALREARDELETRVLERTAELAGSRASIQESEARMGGIVSSAMDAIISVDRGQKIVLFNAAAEKMFRCPAAEAMGQSLDRFIPQRFRAQHAQHVEGFGKTGETSRSMRSLGALSGLRADGEEFPIEASISQVEVAGEKIYTVILRDITERKRAEEAAVLLAAIVDSSFDAIIGKDLRGVVTSWNAGAQKVFGYSASEIIGQSITVLIPPGRQGDEEKILSRIKRGETTEHFETVRRRKDGVLIDVSVTVSPIKDENGEVVGASKVARDITERKQAEVALRESETRLRLVLQAAQIGDWELDPVTQEALCSALHFQIFGYAEPFPEWSVERFVTHLHPEDRERVQGVVRDALAAQEDWRFEGRIIRCDQAVRWIAVQARFFQDLGGHPLRVLGIVEDITERKVAEAALRESEQRLRFTLESCNIGAWDLNLEDHTAYRSVEHDRIFGYAEMLPQWTLEDFLRHALPEYRAEVETMVREATAAMRGWTYECPIRRVDGEIRWIWFSGSYRTDPAGHRRVGGIVMDITERKRAEEAQRASEARYRALFDYAPDGIVIADQQSYYLDANTSVCRMLGYTRDEFIGLHASNIVAPAEIPHIGSALRVLTDKTDYQREWQFRRKDGSVFAAEVIATMMPDGNLMAMIRDVTERKNAEQALHEKEMQLHAADRRLAEIVHGMTEACFALDTEWRFTFVNDRGETLLRHHREQMLGQSIWEVFQKLVGTPMEANYRRAMTERVPVAFETFSPIAERWLDIRLFPTGEGLAAFLLDIHTRKLGEESLRETQTRLNSTLAAGSIGTWTWDIVNDRLAADEFTARMFSIEPDAAAKGLPAEAYLRAILEEDRTGVEAALAGTIQSCGKYDVEYRVRQKDGDIRWLQARGRVEGDAAGQAVSFHGAVMDITDRKRADAALREVEKEKQLAFEASRLKSEFLANMSHELRTPLNCIIGFTEFLVDEKPGPLNPKQKEYLTDVHNSSRHLLQLINDVLDLAKVETGKIDLNPETFPLVKAIEEVCAVVKGIAQKKSVIVKWTVAPELGDVTLDEQKFKQICYNLLANAVKFTDTGGSVGINALAHEGERFELRVKDTGIGIKKEDMQRLFREFEQLESGNARRFEGTGLGLALTKKLVEAQGGSIGVESEYGKGSTFFVVMPIIVADVKNHE